MRLSAGSEPSAPALRHLHVKCHILLLKSLDKRINYVEPQVVEVPRRVRVGENGAHVVEVAARDVDNGAHREKRHEFWEHGTYAGRCCETATWSTRGRCAAAVVRDDACRVVFSVLALVIAWMRLCDCRVIVLAVLATPPDLADVLMGDGTAAAPVGAFARAVPTFIVAAV